MEAKELQKIQDDVFGYYNKAMQAIYLKTERAIKREKQLNDEYNKLRHSIEYLNKEIDDLKNKNGNHYGDDLGKALLPDKEKLYLEKVFKVKILNDDLKRLKQLNDIEIEYLQKEKNRSDQIYKQLFEERNKFYEAIHLQALSDEEANKMGIAKELKEFENLNNILVNQALKDN